MAPTFLPPALLLLPALLFPLALLRGYHLCRSSSAKESRRSIQRTVHDHEGDGAEHIADITTGRATMFASLARPGIVDEARTRLEMQAEFHCFFSRLARPETCSSAPKICSLKPLPLEAQFHSGKARPARSEQSVLSFSVNRSSFLIGELLLGKLSETVVVVGNAPHDRPGFLVGHLIGNRASFLCTKAPMPRVPKTNFLHGITSISG